MSFVPWLKFGGQEIANYNRTVAYISNGLLEDPRVQSAPGCGCDAIDEGPYESPAVDDAPWYTSARPESGDFLGMILDRIDMNEPWARNVSARGGDGSVIGPQRLRGRVLSFRGILYAGSPQAMDYGKRWLSEALRNCDSTCGLGDLCLLPACPEGEADTDRFFRTLKRAALIDGPVEVQIPNVPCDLITQMDWQMAAEVGYLYQDAEECLEETSITAGGSECCLLSTDEWIGDATAKIVVKAGGPNHVTDLLVKATPTKDGVCPADPLLDAEAVWRADSYDGEGDLEDQTSNGHNATPGAGAAAPTWLDYEGEQYLYVPGAATDFVSTPDAAALDIVGDIDLRARVAPTDWTPAAAQFLVGKRGGAGQKSYGLFIHSTGALRLIWTADGTNDISKVSTVIPGFVDGADHYARATLDVDNGAAGNTVRFYTSEDGVTWTQLGADVVTAGVTSIHSGTALATVGAAADGSGLYAGKIYEAEIRSSIGGTVVANPDFTDTSSVTPPFATFADSAGRTWTINRAATGLKSAVVDRDLFLLGTDDYFEVPDSADLDFGATDPFTIMVAVRTYGTPAAVAVLLAKKTGVTIQAGYELVHNIDDTTYLRIGDGAVSPLDSNPALADGTAVAIGGVRRVSLDQLEAYENGAGSGTPTTDTTTATLANAEVLRIGRLSGAGANYGDFEFFGAAIWRRELTADEQTLAMNALLGQAVNEPTPCAEFTIDDLAPGHELIIDGSERTVEVREQLSGRVVGGLDVITPAEGLFQFIDIGACAEVCICLTANGETNANTKVSIEQWNRES